MKNVILLLAVLALAGAFLAFAGSGSGGRGSESSTASGNEEGSTGSAGTATTQTGDSDDVRNNTDAQAPQNGRDDGNERGGEDGNGRRGTMNGTEKEKGEDASRIRGMTRINESKLECSNESTMRERIKCRLRLSREEQAAGLYYLPEECRELESGDKQECMAKYDAVQPCRFMKGDESRFACVKEKLNITKSARDLVEECKAEVRGSANSTGGNTTINITTNSTSGNTTNSTGDIDSRRERGIGKCVSAVRSRLHDEIKFRLYNLEEKAERLKSYGVSEALITSLIQKMEELKAKFDAAGTVEERKAVIAEAEQAWKGFIRQAKQEAGKNTTGG